MVDDQGIYLMKRELGRLLDDYQRCRIRYEMPVSIRVLVFLFENEEKGFGTRG
ncbi:hypothetical protein [Peribacillus glennii]|uniref:hypothetical protein n=1 Tax=Peribacillus glennii TaxID=2303991 RepID=UPI00131494FF|nr:hypothetical protein [Peribacillus glennii]